jgi:hypothetical protein
MENKMFTTQERACMETQLTYKAGDQVEVYDTARKRWYKARTLWLLQYATQDTLEAWDCELRNGNRGSFDSAHMRTCC